jgi:hypothetical protein
MPENRSPQRRVKHRQPPSGYPEGAAAFLTALAAPDAAALADWAAEERPDARWAGWLRDQQLAAQAFYRLRAAGLEDVLSPKLRAPLRATFYGAAGETMLRKRELASALQALGAVGIVPVLFKGAALAHTVYPDPACRPMSDLDLWLAHEEMAPAQAALENLGYHQHFKPTRPIALQAQRCGEIQLFGARDGSGLIELHWGIFAGEWLERTTKVDEAAIRTRCVPVAVVGHEALKLAPEDGLIQLAVHLAINHQFAQPFVRGLLDVALLARAQPIDWAAVAARARAWRVGTVVWTVLRLAADLLGLDEAGPAMATLSPSPLRRGLLSLFVSQESLLRMRDLRHGPSRFGLQLLLVDRPRDAVRLLWRAIWPEREWLALRYGAMTPTVRRRHLFAALRGQV